MEDRRIGSPTGYYTFAIIALIVAFLALLAPAETGSLGPIILSVAVCALVIGFWVSLFGSIEQRLMDIQGALIKGSTGEIGREQPPQDI